MWVGQGVGGVQVGIGVIAARLFEHVRDQVEDEGRMNAVALAAEQAAVEGDDEASHGSLPKNSPMV